ncbi:hypothetical protein [Priestia koreensis]|nr:hypothetical protein [Priestia koreensis]
MYLSNEEEKHVVRHIVYERAYIEMNNEQAKGCVKRDRIRL